MANKDKVILIFLLSLLAFIWAVIFSLPNRNLHISFCDVGQGDGILISKGKTQILIDGGPDSKVLKCLSDNIPFWDRQIEMVFLTHPDGDHAIGLIDVLERYKVKYFVLNKIGKNEEFFKILVKKLILENPTYIFAEKNAEIKLGEVHLRLLWPDIKTTDSNNLEKLIKDKNNSDEEEILNQFSIIEDSNEHSIVLRLDYGNFCLFLPGDISSETEDLLNTQGSCEILKVAHHGSRYSTSDSFLKKLKPKLAVISVGKNSFGHPSKEIIKRLENQGVKVLRTDERGTVNILTNGKDFWLKK
jgi:competence protein ComEC